MRYFERRSRSVVRAACYECNYLEKREGKIIDLFHIDKQSFDKEPGYN